GAAEQQVERQAVQEHVVLVELRRRGHVPAPARQAQRALLDAAPRQAPPRNPRLPASGTRRPDSNAPSVDLPPPDGPSSSTRSPCRMSSEQPDSTGAVRPGYRNATSRGVTSRASRAPRARGAGGARRRGGGDPPPAAVANMGATCRHAMRAAPSAGNACASL